MSHSLLEEEPIETPNNENDIIDANEEEEEQEQEQEQEQEEQDEDEDVSFHELFGSDDDNDNNNNNDTAKVLSREYKRSVPEGKKVSISTNISLSSLPTGSLFDFFILRLPNVIGCDIDPFDESSYIEPSQTASTASSIDNYIRWRTHYESASDETYKESNTKLVEWKDGSKSLIIGNDCYDIDDKVLTGNRDYIYAEIDKYYKLCHAKFIKRLNVRTTTQKSYKTLQKNLAKKHQRTKGSKQLSAAQRRSNNNKLYGSNKSNIKSKQESFMKTMKTNKKKRSLKESWLEQGGHDDDSSDDYHNSSHSRKRQKRSYNQSDDDDDDDDESDDDESDDDSESDSESDDDDDDDEPIGARIIN